MEDLRQRAHGYAANTSQMDPASGREIVLDFRINMGHGICFLPERQKIAGICLFCKNVLYYKMTVMIGGTLPMLHSGYRVGKGDTIILESCEYCNSFLHFFPTVAVVLNVRFRWA